MRYSLKDLFWAVTLIALGLSAWPLSMELARMSGQAYSDAILLPIGGLLVSGAAIGAGLLSPFKMQAVGAVIGALTMLTVVSFRAY